MHTPNDVRIDTEQRQGITLARTAGEIDALSAPRLREFVGDQLAAARDFVLDLDEVTFLSSAGLQVLLDTDRAVLSRRLRWALVGTTRAVARPLEVTGLAPRLPLQPSVPAALQLVARP
ncbi:anti-sigma factor antagonist [Amycolatopsis pithecellobii]|uniref:Anti-sigma factor antagonist n=1 Tax=Amycolatopsis pithecellobii TaxID=664692 RepID=A0A6N7YZJ7_9PSEU|nr:anti-sigma factor antagonist [Amycolatopsis pithecellobii]MTD57342.1 anti-sigma factor antagonist [Amycolatopsis pithecellobii]